jgi:hypothetical protein
MKHVIYFIIILLQLPSINSLAQGWECNDCPRRSLGLFDCDVQVPQPSWGDPLTLGDWLEFNFVAAGIHSELMDKDPSRDCLSFYDGQFVLEAETNPEFDSASYKISYNWQNLPGPGSLSYVDYIIYATLIQSGPNYFLTVNLEAGKTRELAATNTVQYNLSLNGGDNGKLAVQPLIPLMEKIREFEKEKRNELTNVAIDASLEVKPQKVYLHTNESTQINLILKDCDDFKLPNREIHLTSTAGGLSSYSVNTNQDGEAQVTYTAGGSPAWVEIYAEHLYDYPHGLGVIDASDAKFISVQKSPVDVWDFKVTADVRFIKYADTTWSISAANSPTITHYRSFYESYSGNLTLAGLITNECSGNGNEFCYTGNDLPIIWFVYGNAGEFSKEKSTEYFNGVLKTLGETITYCNALAAGSKIRTDYYNMQTDNAGLYLEYSDGLKYFEVNGYGNGQANYHSKEWMFGDYWEPFQGTYSRSASVAVSWDESMPGGSLTYQDSAYILSYSNTETIYEPDPYYGMKQTTVSKNLNGIIKPFYRTITDVDANHFTPVAIPKYFELTCYPNPFNPSTIISWGLPASGLVTLKIFNSLGEEIKTLVNEYQETGYHSTLFVVNSSLPSGVYFYQIKAGNFISTKKMILLK